MLSVGEAELAINKCSQLWEGETSTIFPLSPIDRKAVLDTARNWILEDLSVVAFTYAPIPYTFESKADPKKKVIYLVDNSGISPPSDPAVQSVAPQTSASFTTPSTTPSAEEDYYWKLTENQVRSREIWLYTISLTRLLPSSFGPLPGLPRPARFNLRSSKVHSPLHQKVQPLRRPLRLLLPSQHASKQGTRVKTRPRNGLELRDITQVTARSGARRAPHDIVVCGLGR